MGYLDSYRRNDGQIKLSQPRISRIGVASYKNPGPFGLRPGSHDRRARMHSSPQMGRKAGAGEAPTKHKVRETYLLVKLGNAVLGTILERGHFQNWTCRILRGVLKRDAMERGMRKQSVELALPGLDTVRAVSRDAMTYTAPCEDAQVNGK